MEDTEIIDLYWQRDQRAIDETHGKYGGFLAGIAWNILRSHSDAEECVSDVWLRLWNAIPPERPRSLAAYITTVTRRLGLDKCDYNRAAQRRSDLTVAFEELEGCLPGYVTETLRQALPLMDKKLHGFAAPDAVLTGVETRSSSPVRILRGEDLQSALRGLYPCGEGAGYAGGILSAAADGMHCAEQLCQSIQKESDCL